MKTSRRLKKHKSPIAKELLVLCTNESFEVHHSAPPFWNDILNKKMDLYLKGLPSYTYATCPHCGFRLEAPEFPSQFENPWWIYPQKAFDSSSVCPHFELLTFSILWTHSEPVGPPWTIPCGWGVPALTESLSQSDNFSLTVKTHQLPNGATIFWMGLFKEFPSFPSINDYWPIPILKTANPVKPTLNSRGYWGDYQPLTIHSPIVWSRLYLESPSGKLVSYKDHKDTGAWLQKIRSWIHAAYTQPLKMQKHRFISESGLASFALGMRSSRQRGALFIAQTPIFQVWSHSVSRIQDQEEKKKNQPNPGPHIQSITLNTMKDFAETGSLWLILDPFQNEVAQDWLRLIKRHTDEEPLPLWRESDIKNQWYLTADSTADSTLGEEDLVGFYRDLSPVLINVNPSVLELSLHYPLGQLSWGSYFLSSESEEVIHAFLRQKLVAFFQNQWIYFRFYEPHFLSVALSILPSEERQNFLGPIDGWIFPHSTEHYYTLHSSTETQNPFSLARDFHRLSLLSPPIHEVAQRVFQFDQPQRVKNFIFEKTPEFAELLPEKVMKRWIRESVRQAESYGINKEGNIIKFFLWKILITPTWCFLPPFQKILSQSVAEEIKVQKIESLLPQLRLSDLPRHLTIESWDPELWSRLKDVESPLAQADPEVFHTLLGEHPPAMPLQQPNWLRALGLFYENAYLELQSQSGLTLLDDIFYTEIKRPLHPPPRLLSLSDTNLIVRDEGKRSHAWLKKNGFENLHSTGGNWIFRSNSRKNLLLTARRFLEDYPYLDSRQLLMNLSDEEKRQLNFKLDLFSIIWDAHQFWQIKSLSSAA